MQRLHCVCLVVNPNTLGGKPKVCSRTNLGCPTSHCYLVFFPLLLLAHKPMCFFSLCIFSSFFNEVITYQKKKRKKLCYLSKKEKESGVIATHIIKQNLLLIECYNNVNKQILSMICVQFDDYLG